MFNSIAKIHEMKTEEITKVFESFKANYSPKNMVDPYFEDLLQDLEIFLSCCKRISDSWKIGVAFSNEDKALFDNFLTSFEKAVPNPAFLPAICRQVGSGVKFSEFSSVDRFEDTFVDLSGAKKQDVGYLIGATSDYLEQLWDPFYKLAKSRMPKSLSVRFYVAVPVADAENCRRILRGLDDVSIIPVDQVRGGKLNKSTHSYKSSTRFYALSSLINRKFCNHYVLTDLDALVPNEFDYSFPCEYKNILLRFWMPEYPFHWRNISAGFMYIRQSDDAQEFSINLNRSLNAYQLTKTMDLCGDQIALDAAMREQTQGVPVAKMSFKLDSWYGSLADKREQMLSKLLAMN